MTMMEEKLEVPVEIEEAIKSILEKNSREDAALILAYVARKAAIELHKLAREEANRRKGGPDWGRWASLMNAARELVLNTTTSRDVAARIAGRPR